MDADPKKILGRLSRAPFSFGIACFGMGIILSDGFSRFGFSSGAKELIGSLTAGLGIFFFGMNCTGEDSCKLKTDEGKSEREEQVEDGEWEAVEQREEREP